MKGGTIIGWTLVAFMAATQLMAQQGEVPILHPKTTSMKSPGNAQAVCIADADIGDSRRQHGAAATAEHQPERTDELGRQFSRNIHSPSPSTKARIVRALIVGYLTIFGRLG